MPASSFCASRPRDARRSRSSDSDAAPSQQNYNLARNLSSPRRVLRRGAAGSTSRRDAAAPRGGTRAARSISSVAAASAPSQQHQLRRSRQQHQQATAVSCDDERSTGAHLLKLFQNVHSKCYRCSSSSNIPSGKSWVSLTL